MQFCYLKGSIDGCFAISDFSGVNKFSLNVVTHDQSINESNIYLLSEYQYEILNNAISGRDDFQLFPVNDYVYSNKLLKPIQIGAANINNQFGGSGLSLKRSMDHWRSEDLSGIKLGLIGGFGSDPVYSLASSSVLSKALSLIYDNGFTAGVDILLDKQMDNELSPFLQPVNTILSLPASLEFLNNYDGIWISDEESVNRIGLNSAENYFDFYCDVYGIERCTIAPVFVQESHVEELMFATVQSLKSSARLPSSAKVAAIDFTTISDSAKSLVWEFLKNEFRDTVFVTLNDDEFYREKNIISLNNLIDSVSKRASFFANIDLLISGSSDNIYISACFNLPTIHLSNMSVASSKYKGFFNCITVTEISCMDRSGHSYYKLLNASNFIKGVWYSNLPFENLNSKFSNNEELDGSPGSKSILTENKSNNYYISSVNLVGGFVCFSIGFLIGFIC